MSYSSKHIQNLINETTILLNEPIVQCASNYTEVEQLTQFIDQYYKLSKIASGYRTLYHFSRSGGLPQPRPNKRGDKWTRPALKEDAFNVIFLTDDPYRVRTNHYIYGNLFKYKVSEKIIAASGGLNSFSGAKEILIPEEIWNKGLASGEIKLLGKEDIDKWKKMPPRHNENYLRTNKYKELYMFAMAVNDHAVKKQIDKLIKLLKNNPPKYIESLVSNKKHIIDMFQDIIDTRKDVSEKLIDKQNPNIPEEIADREIKNNEIIINILTKYMESFD